MIKIDAIVDSEGLLKSCNVAGHAQAGPKGHDIVCAAVSALTMTSVRVLSNRAGIRVQGGAPKRGILWMKIEYTPEGKDFLFAAGTFLLEGLKSVSEDYPDHCKISIFIERRN
ncbi:MAG: ribosomal-processing cysteine protease Prp [Treponema sp.]|jgi:uncharacterized protein YsxB (DUF464 family)|nr:ribosomal-processing cysteine protease Prp [Treponema sp.]